MPWRGVPWAGEKGNSPPHGHTMRERPGAPLWPKGRPCADGSVREESRKTRSPSSFRRGKTRPAALTQPMICVPTGKTRRGHAGRVADARSKDAPAALTIAPPRPCVPTLGATFTRSPAMRPGRHPVMGCRSGCRAECDFAGRGPSPPDLTYASPETRLAAPFRTPPRRVTRRVTLFFTGGGRSPADRRYASRQSNRVRRATVRGIGSHHGRAPDAGRRCR